MEDLGSNSDVPIKDEDRINDTAENLGSDSEAPIKEGSQNGATEDKSDDIVEDAKHYIISQILSSQCNAI